MVTAKVLREAHTAQRQAMVRLVDV
jgi:hypothetical protein